MVGYSSRTFWIGLEEDEDFARLCSVRVPHLGLCARGC